MKVARFIPFLGLLLCSTGLQAQNSPDQSSSTLRVNSRAVLVDVVVTDNNGAPIKGLTRDSFRIREQGTVQKIDFFEEHRGLTPALARRASMPQLPPDEFSNYSPIAIPPAVNILLIDALNTPMADQMYLRKSAAEYLKNLKPGTRIAIFTMSMRLRFVQGFSDDPILLARALGYQKGNTPEPAALLPSTEESNVESLAVGLMNYWEGAGPGKLTNASAAAMITSFQQFMKENHYAQTADREYRTLANLQQLASYLSAVPGRKNLIWLSGAFPLDFFGLTDMRFDEVGEKTVNLLAAARVALYPVDVRGAQSYSLYQANNTLDGTKSTPQEMIGPAQGYSPDLADPSTINTGRPAITTTSGGFDHDRTTEGMRNNVSNTAMEMIASNTGGKAYYNQNDLVRIIDDVIASSSDFYTISYSPADGNMDGAFRKIGVEIPGAHYKLSYRRGYYALQDARPGAAQDQLNRAVQQASNTEDPLQPFMDFGLPQTDQILYKERIVPSTTTTQKAPLVKINAPGPYNRYGIDFAVDPNDLGMRVDSTGLHNDTLILSLIVYNKYGDIISHREHRVALQIKPDEWNALHERGLQIHADIDVPNGQYWLRTGVYDQASRKIGTLEVPLSFVHPVERAANPQHNPVSGP